MPNGVSLPLMFPPSRDGGRQTVGERARGAALPKGSAAERLFLRRHRAQIGDKIIEVAVSHSRIKLVSHRRLELGAVLALE